MAAEERKKLRGRIVVEFDLLDGDDNPVMVERAYQEIADSVEGYLTATGDDILESFESETMAALNQAVDDGDYRLEWRVRLEIDPA